MRIVLLGPPGAGKGTQAAQVACRFGCPHIATGDIFRANVAEGTELGRAAQEYMDRGDLVPDAVVIAMVMERLAERDCASGFVLDGFPRTVNQAEALDRRLVEIGSPLEAALSFDVTEEELLRRLAGRAAAQHRADDAEQTIRHRLEVFAVKTRPLIDYYRHRRLLTMVDGVGRVEDVTVRILDGLPVPEGGRDAALALAV
ncbi:MAG TPA: adenylate kinase [Actinomycetes bacterium]|nr:adenylate kinase [Actinomycetes bacterium]